MHHPNVEEEQRPIVLRTLEGEIVGTLPVNPDSRTLDWINREGGYLSIVAESLKLPDCNLEPGEMAVNSASVIFVAERTLGSPRTDRRVEATHFRRCAVTLRVADCDIHGYVHVRDTMGIVRHLTRAAGPFFAVTAASIVGPDFELITNFVAVNASHVVAIQSVDALLDTQAAHSLGASGMAAAER